MTDARTKEILKTINCFNYPMYLSMVALQLPTNDTL